MFCASRESGSSWRSVERGGMLSSQAALTLAAGGDLTNSGGQIVAGGDLEISADAVAGNADGLIGAVGGGVALTAANAIDNANGRIEASGALALTGTGLDNTAGRIVGQDTVTLLADAMDNSQGLVSAERTLALTADTLRNADGLIQAFADGEAASTLTLQGAFDNRGGTLGVNHDLDIHAASLDSRGGQIVGKTLNLTTTGAVDNGAGILSSQGALTLAAGANLANVGGQIVAETSLQVTAHAVDNTEGTLGAVGGRLDLVAAERIGNAGGRIEAFGPLTLTGAGFDNSRGTVLGQTLQLDTRGALDNRDGLIGADGNLVIEAAGKVDNGDGRILGNGLLTLTAGGNLTSTDGQIVAGSDLAVTAQSIGNVGGTLAAVTGSLDVYTPGDIDNRGGRIEAAGNLTLTGEALDNSETGIVLGQTLAITSHGRIDNRSGKLVAEGALTAEGSAIDNSAGAIQSGGDLVLDARSGALINTNTRDITQGLSSQGTMRLTARDGIDNAAGRIIAGALTLEAASLTNADGEIQTLADIDAQVRGTFDNTSGLLHARGVRVAAVSISNRETLGANQGIEGEVVELSANMLDNTRGALRADRLLELAVGERLDNSGGLISRWTRSTSRTPIPALTVSRSSIPAARSLPTNIFPSMPRAPPRTASFSAARI
jgi:adhesin HecA-like repeat protein